MSVTTTGQPHWDPSYRAEVLSSKTVTLSRVALNKVSSDVTLKVRVIYLQGNSRSESITLNAAMSLGEAIQAMFDARGESEDLDWNILHWVSLEGDQPFYHNAGANSDGTSVEEEPGANDWYCAAGVELRVA